MPDRSAVGGRNCHNRGLWPKVSHCPPLGGLSLLPTRGSGICCMHLAAPHITELSPWTTSQRVGHSSHWNTGELSPLPKWGKGRSLPVLVRSEWTQLTCSSQLKQVTHPRQTTPSTAKRPSEGTINSINEGDDWLYWSNMQSSFLPWFSKG